MTATQYCPRSGAKRIARRLPKDSVSLSLAVVLLGLSHLSAMAQEPTGPLTGYGDGVKWSLNGCPQGQQQGQGQGQQSPCKPTGSRMTARLVNGKWFMGKASPQFPYPLANYALYSGVHAVRLVQAVQYGNEYYYNAAGSMTPSLSYTPTIGSSTTLQKFKSYCYAEGPTGYKFLVSKYQRTAAVTNQQRPEFFSVLMRLTKHSACRIDPIRCTGQTPPPPTMQSDWQWECNWADGEFFNDEGTSGPILTTSTYSPITGPVVRALGHGFITHDKVAPNKADSEISNNKYYVTPLSLSAKYGSESQVTWGHDYPLDSDGVTVKLYQTDGSTWKVCMNVSPCATYNKGCAGLPGCGGSAQDGDGGYQGAVRGSPLGINSSEFDQLPSMFSTALSDAVDEYNSAVPGVQLFELDGSNILIDVIMNDERESYDWVAGPVENWFTRHSAINGQTVIDRSDQQLVQLAPGCLATQITGATIRIGEEWFHPRTGDDWEDGEWAIEHEPWPANRLKSVLMHELSHAILSIEHADGVGGITCLSGSINCDGQSSLTSLTQDDLDALNCMYGLATPTP